MASQPNGTMDGVHGARSAQMTQLLDVAIAGVPDAAHAPEDLRSAESLRWRSRACRPEETA